MINIKDTDKEKVLNFLLEQISNMDSLQRDFLFNTDTSELPPMNHIDYDNELARQLVQLADENIDD